ncbi:toll/interleukin-1 receptor domain-containing protein [Micromonospora profundi]|uniref:toll/interleukin-1 receptor domain-containing protein n=1 Tax=Micromonospora profundi TaxID=1420889 RepID=UPI0033A0AD78
MPNVFVSHASLDTSIVDPFVDTILQLGCGVPRKSIFYSSRRSTGIPAGANLGSYIRETVQEADLIIAIISPTFQSRPYCAAELGAAWGVSNKLFPILTPGMKRTNLDGVLPSLLTEFLDDSSALDELHEMVCDVFGSSPGPLSWNEHKNSFLANIGRYMEGVPSPTILSAKDYERALNDAEGARAALRTAQGKIASLEYKIEQLAAAKDRESVAAILVDEDEKKEFEKRRRAAARLIKTLPSHVQESAFLQYVDGAFPGFKKFDDDWNDAMNSARLEGYVSEVSEGEFVLNEDHVDVEEALVATNSLGSFLDGASEDFKKWFRGEYRISPDLTKRKVWQDLMK